MPVNENFEIQLNTLLDEPVATAMERERSTFDSFSGALPSLVLFGVGVLGRQTLAGLRKVQTEPVAFCDNNPATWNTVVDGVPVLPPAEAVAKFGDRAAFVVTIWRDIGGHPLSQIASQLQALGSVKVISIAALNWKYAEVFLPYFFLDLPHRTLEQADAVRAAFFLWDDEFSRREYVAQIRWRLWLDFAGLSPRVPWKPYLPEGCLFDLQANDIFVDCGAYDGDTLRDFLDKQGSAFRGIYAVEPDPGNFAKIQSFLKSRPAELRQKVTVRQAAVGAKAGTVCFDAAGTAQSAISTGGTLTVECITLDDLFPSEPPTYVKMDIEGAEPDAIAGAARIIRESAPILAICVYHRFDHLWKLPLLIRSLSDRYRFYLRPHADACWDLVCYAVPRERIKGG